MKLRTHLFLLTLVTVVPMTLFAAGLAAYHAQSQRESVERGMRDTARAMVLALDRDIRDIKTGVQTLAGSRYLDGSVDLPRFYEEAASVSRSFGGWAVLSEPSGRQLLNTSRPLGTPLPLPTPESLAMMRSVAVGRRTFVSNVFLGTVSRRPAVIVAVPILRGGEVRYILDFPMEPRQFTSLLQETRLSPGWIAVITDREGGVVARAPEAEAFVGRKAPPAWVERTVHADEGLIHGELLSGSPVYAAFTRSTESGWIVGVAVPTRLVEASFRRSLLLISAGGVLVLGVGAALAFVLGTRIAGPIAALADSLETQSAPGPSAKSRVTEIEELRRALEDAIARRQLLATEQAARAVAEQRADREELANRGKDDFLAVLSHELRTPLNSMLGWVRLLRGGHLDAAQSAHALDVIERNVGQQSRLISDLLDVSRIIAGRFELTLQPVDLPALVAAVMDAVRPTAEAKEITVTMRLDADAGPVRGDPERLRQVVENVVGNAVKFTPRGGHVMVQLVRDDEARLVVSDNGKGIAPDFLPHIFERFRQADSTSTRAHAGLGLGLAIVRHLVELHGGRVAAESEGEGRGATFMVTLPLMAASQVVVTAGDRETRPADDSPRLDGLKVLVVDDDPDTRNLLATLLAEHGAAPTTVADAREGLAAARRLVPDVIVCDIAMPGDDGYTLIGQLRTWAETAGASIAALALTAYARREDRDRALAAGFDAHLAKPVEPAHIVAVIARLAAQSTSRSETT
jgi:signal transduction histidine kinase/ActR/RegA family two-component response regulator